jgi:hypothetical protein
LIDYSFDGIFACVTWDVEVTDEFEAWWDRLSSEEREEIAAKVELLEERGPTLPRPHVDRVHQSRHQNMKELRGELGGKSNKEYLRVLFAFDPHWIALLLLGGDKTNDPGALKRTGTGTKKERAGARTQEEAGKKSQIISWKIDGKGWNVRQRISKLSEIRCLPSPKRGLVNWLKSTALRCPSMNSARHSKLRKYTLESCLTSNNLRYRKWKGAQICT